MCSFRRRVSWFTLIVLQIVDIFSGKWKRNSTRGMCVKKCVLAQILKKTERSATYTLFAFEHCRDLCTYYNFNSLYRCILVAFSSKGKTSCIMVWMKVKFLTLKPHLHLELKCDLSISILYLMSWCHDSDLHLALKGVLDISHSYNWLCLHCDRILFVLSPLSSFIPFNN